MLRVEIAIQEADRSRKEAKAMANLKNAAQVDDDDTPRTPSRKRTTALVDRYNI
jgi:hypothetical protein